MPPAATETFSTKSTNFRHRQGESYKSQNAKRREDRSFSTPARDDSGSHQEWQRSERRLETGSSGDIEAPNGDKAAEADRDLFPADYQNFFQYDGQSGERHIADCAPEISLEA
jgi:hypothetical protein